jgi:Mg2+ and Co2+ transporter CorA
MNGPSQDQEGTFVPSAIGEEIQRLLVDIRQFRTQAEEEYKSTATARKNADSEGLFAFNAKKACEEHSTVVSQIKGSVESEMASIFARKQKADEYLAALNTAKATIEADTKLIADRRKEAEAVSQSIATISETCFAHAQDIDKTRASAEDSVRSANTARDLSTEAQKGAEASQEKAAASMKDAQEKMESINEYLKSISQHAVEVQKALTDAKESETSLKDVLEHLIKSNNNALEYETRLAKLADESEDLIKRVDSLLPGAASASLASSFNAQKQRCAQPQKRWLTIFISSILGLVVIALPSFLAALGIPIPGHSTDSSTPDIWRSLLLRMPIAIPLVWLAIYAGRNYMLSVRLEEEYAYKEAISTAFEGYKRELSQISVSDPTNPTPLIKLCTNILAAIAERPGRIYEGKHNDITIMNETQEMARNAVDLAAKQVAAR